ncbi:hypothetical protein D3M70_02465 [Pseudomonas sp. LS-2]|jgi:hypothetical protein|nr:hypothetical protein D3M70_02465 [Pseudomonas sp. LS-2]
MSNWLGLREDQRMARQLFAVIIDGMMPPSREGECLCKWIDPPKHLQRIHRLFAEDFTPTEICSVPGKIMRAAGSPASKVAD